MQVKHSIILLCCLFLHRYICLDKVSMVDRTSNLLMSNVKSISPFLSINLNAWYTKIT